MSYKNLQDMNQIIERLSAIDKSKLSEREFFHQILSAINDIHNTNFTKIEYQSLVHTLKRIGCVDYETWKEQKFLERKVIVSDNVDIAINAGSIVGAAGMIGNLVSSFQSPESVIKLITKKYNDKDSMLQIWLENSQKIIDGEATEELLQQISDSEKSEERIFEEKEVRENIEKKVQLSEDIAKIEVEIARLQSQLLEKKKELEALKNVR